MDEIRDEMKKIWKLDIEIASLTYKLYEIYDENRNLAIGLFGQKAKFPDLFENSIVRRMDFYLFARIDET